MGYCLSLLFLVCFWALEEKACGNKRWYQQHDRRRNICRGHSGSAN
jgi:hypothetical protein